MRVSKTLDAGSIPAAPVTKKDQSVSDWSFLCAVRLVSHGVRCKCALFLCYTGTHYCTMNSCKVCASSFVWLVRLPAASSRLVTDASCFSAVEVTEEAEAAVSSEKAEIL